MKILLACLSYRQFTGSEIYFYELSSALKSSGHSVSIYSPFVGPPLRDKTTDICFPDKETITSTEYDLVVFSHGKVTWDYIKDIKAKKIINVVHSEVLELEQPLIDNKVDLYVGIRPTIVEFLEQTIADKPVRLIYNPFDLTRFNPQKCKKRKDVKDKVVLFPGSLDYLRYKPLKYLLDLSEKQNFKVLHVGRSDYSTVHPNFASHEPTWEVEKYYEQCDIVSGIFLGRTSIEGLLCGKKVLQFNVDNSGAIQEVYWHTEADLKKFNKNNTANNLLKIFDTI